MKTTFIEKQQKGLLKKFHTLLGRCGIDSEGKAAILSSYNVESSKDLTVYELIDICDKLDASLNTVVIESDKWRKRVIAAIGSYLRAMGKREDMSMIRDIACRAADKENFNKIPLDRLRSIYNAFTLRTKDLKSSREIDGEILLDKIINEICLN